MRLAVLLIFLASPVAAWEFRAEPLCTVSHETGDIALEMTFDSGTGTYRIALTTAAPWPPGAIFGIRFDGPFAMTITSDRQLIEDGGRTVAVTDTGFGNVLNGLEFNEMATPFLGGQGVAIPLAGAGPAIRSFRECVRTGPSV